MLVILNEIKLFYVKCTEKHNSIRTSCADQRSEEQRVKHNSEQGSDFRAWVRSVLLVGRVPHSISRQESASLPLPHVALGSLPSPSLPFQNETEIPAVCSLAPSFVNYASGSLR